MKKCWKALMAVLCCILALSLFGAVACSSSCNGDKKVTKPTTGKITGVVMDEEGNPLEEAEIFYNLVDEDDEEETFTTESDEDGKFELKNVPVGNITLQAALTGYAAWSKELTEANFDNDGVANLNVVLYEGKGTVTGTVYLSGHTEIKLEGVDVKVAGTTIAAKTDANGKYTLENVPMLNNHTVQISCDGYASTNLSVTKRQYKDNVATLASVGLVQNDVEDLKGFKPYSLQKGALAESLLFIKSGDIATYFEISANNLYGTSKVETHSEGLCINADTPNEQSDMAAFISTKIKVDANHKYITVSAATFEGQNGNDGVNHLAKLGLYVFHANDDSKKVSDKNYALDKTNYAFTEITAYNPTYQHVTFDLSRYDGEEVVLVIGSKYGYHCVVRDIEFSAEELEYIQSDIEGVTEWRAQAANANNSFAADALKSEWTIVGAASAVEQGVMLNCKDPWKAYHYDAANPQPVNSYLYITKNLTAANSTIRISTTLINIGECLDPGNAADQGPYYPYLQVFVVSSTGKTLFASGWHSPWEDIWQGGSGDAIVEANKNHTLTYDLSGAMGEGVTIIIACNVGYKATITNVEFTDGSQAASVESLEALPVSNKYDD